MSLYSLDLNSFEAVKALLKKLSASSKETDPFADQLLLAEDGETYLIDDIKALTPEEAEDSFISFKTENNDSLSLKDVYKALQTNDQTILQTLIYNQSLADMLVTRTSPVNALFSPIIFPMTSYLENTHEELEIKGFLDFCEKKGIAQHDPLLNAPLTRDQLLPNFALQQLIKLKIEYLGSVFRKNLERTPLLEKYELSLLDKKILLNDQVKLLKRLMQAKHDYYHEHPELKNKSIDELKKIIKQNQTRINILNMLIRDPIFTLAVAVGMTGFIILLGISGILAAALGKPSILALLFLPLVASLVTYVIFVNDGVYSISLSPLVDKCVNEINRLRSFNNDCLTPLIDTIYSIERVEEIRLIYQEKMPYINSLLANIQLDLPQEDNNELDDEDYLSEKESLTAAEETSSFLEKEPSQKIGITGNLLSSLHLLGSRLHLNRNSHVEYADEPDIENGNLRI